MGLQKYHSKRNFKVTSEPAGRATKAHDHPLQFVVQEHHASALHYDFRLEMEGVLRSWAVPKGPSDDPGVKRLAVEVEDHPIEYGKFQGVIPKGEYGAGRVIRWDKGTWQCFGDPVTSYKKGRIDFALKGDKLVGRWLLVRTHQMHGSQKQWLLIKRHDDKVASVTRASSRRKDEIAEPDSDSRSVKGSAAKKTSKIKTLDHRVKMPQLIDPQLARLVKSAPTGDEWLHEMKFDGYRLQARIEGREIKFITRGGKDWTEKFLAIKTDLESIGLKDTILDGEVVCLNKDGLSDFGCLQNTLSRDGTHKKSLIYYVFDIPFLNGNDLRSKTLLERKELLDSVLKVPGRNKTSIRISEYIQGRGPEFFKQCCAKGLEGIISKNASSPYSEGRSDDWLKVKCGHRQEFVIGGYTEPRGSRSDFGALLLGLNENGKLRYVGKTGTGFDADKLRSLKVKFDKLLQRQSPFDNLGEAKDVHWLKPQLVAEIKFAGFTEGHNVRQASFVGLREDKVAKAVVPEVAMAVPQKTTFRKAKSAELAGLKKTKLEMPKNMKLAKTFKTKGKNAKSSGVAESREGAMTLTHPDRVLFEDTGITKQDLADYYTAIWDNIAPYIVNRPLTLLRGAGGGKSHPFYQRHAESIAGPWIHEIEIKEPKDEDQRKPYLYIDSLAGLLNLVQMGTLEIHAWSSVVKNINKADTVIFDLDPDKGFPWKGIVAAAVELKGVLQGLGLKSFLKVSGGKGLHLQVPIQPLFDVEKVKAFSHAVVKIMMERNPELYTDNMRKDARKGKIFIDYLRNGFASTAVIPYGVRNRPGTPVALPISWKDLDLNLKPDQFRMREVVKYLGKQKKDPWADYWKVQQTIEVLK